MGRIGGPLCPPIQYPVSTAEEYVVLVDSAGTPIGRQLKSTVHHRATPRHLAFSLYLFDDDGRLLMTRRALTKHTWPGVWTNTCCGHPAPEEAPTAAIDRRLQFELGLGAVDLRVVLPDFAYRTMDVSGIWENELCPVFVGSVPESNALRRNEDEVMDHRWVEWDSVVTAMSAAPFAFSPWAIEQVQQLAALGLHSTVGSSS